ncbi:unnamed protein product [Paramecium primaurelia]|uniref:Uncharacterized protein n=1 Tax=Paramecium primaurelia TaxID=5886 RepID=A0A8S1NK85_PARPR|nr:unnamed protein product [Paramecium primaurelia]
MKINRRHLLFLKEDDFIILKSNEATKCSKINLHKYEALKSRQSKQFGGNSLFEGNKSLRVAKNDSQSNQDYQHQIKQLEEVYKNVKEFFISKYMIQMYNSQQQKNLMGLINEIKKEVSYNKKNKKKNYTPEEVLDLEIIDYYQIAFEVWNNLILLQKQIIQELDGLYKKLQTIFETDAILPNQKTFQFKRKEQSMLFLMHQNYSIQQIMTFIASLSIITFEITRIHENQKNLWILIVFCMIYQSNQMARTMCKNLMTKIFQKNEKKEKQQLNEFLMMMINMGLIKKILKAFHLSYNKYKSSLSPLIYIKSQSKCYQKKIINCLKFLSNVYENIQRIITNLGIYHLLKKKIRYFLSDYQLNYSFDQDHQRTRYQFCQLFDQYLYGNMIIILLQNIIRGYGLIFEILNSSHQDRQSFYNKWIQCIKYID